MAAAAAAAAAAAFSVAVTAAPPCLSELAMALTFSAAPLTLYLPPPRSLCLFVEAIEAVLDEIGAGALSFLRRLRIAYSRANSAWIGRTR